MIVLYMKNQIVRTTFQLGEPGLEMAPPLVKTKNPLIWLHSIKMRHWQKRPMLVCSLRFVACDSSSSGNFISLDPAMREEVLDLICPHFFAHSVRSIPRSFNVEVPIFQSTFSEAVIIHLRGLCKSLQIDPKEITESPRMFLETFIAFEGKPIYPYVQRLLQGAGLMREDILLMDVLEDTCM